MLPRISMDRERELFFWHQFFRSDKKFRIECEDLGMTHEANANVFGHT